MTSIKKKQEEKNLKILRELLTFENNRYCFDCNQRGPTYVNITIGSFVCTNCGGALRKYNHRVKSISMSNFNQSEMDFIKKRGNNICKKIYYGLCDNNTPPEPDIKNGMLDSHLRSKYELKKWYSEPTPEIEEETLSANQLIFDKIEKGVPKTVKNYTVNSSSNIIIDPPKQFNSKLPSSRGSRTSVEFNESSVSHPKSSNGIFHETIDPSKLSGGSAIKLPMPTDAKTHNWFTDNNKTKPVNPSPFEDDFIFPVEKPDIGNSFPVIPKSQTMNFNMPPLVPLHPTVPGQNIPLSESQNNYIFRDSKNTDKYAVLAELDDLFSNVNINKQNPNIFSTALDSSNRLSTGTTGVPSNIGWMSNNQFGDVHSNSISNPFSPPSQHMTSTFNPFVSHNETNPQHMPSQISHNWPRSEVAPVASLTGNPFANSIKTEPMKSKNPFL